MGFTYTNDDPYIEITNKCNLHCSHCYNSSGNDRKDELAVEEVISLLKAIKKLDIKKVRISGGEPLLHPGWKEILDKCKELGFSILLLTNGSLITDEVAKILKGYDILIQVSLEDMNEENHNRLRGAGSFEKAMQGIESLVASDLASRINISTTLTKLNLEGIENIVELGAREGFNSIIFNRIRKDGRAKNKLYFEQALDFNAHLKLIDKMNAISSGKKGDLELEFQPYGGGCRLLSRNPRLMLRIAPNGDVFPCRGFTGDSFCIGNIRAESLEQIIQGDTLAGVITQLQQRKPKVDKCRKCHWQMVCAGGCAADAELNTGTIYETDAICDVRNHIWTSRMKNHIQTQGNRF